MTILNNYRCAMQAAFPEISEKKLRQSAGTGGSDFVSFVIDHGLGPLWHERIGHDEFIASRMAAEALYAAQAAALSEIDTALAKAGIEYAVIKGGASRLVLYDNPAIRACHDIDLIVSRVNRVNAATALSRSGFNVHLVPLNISHQLMLTRDPINIDLHWGLLRDGRLRKDTTVDMLARRKRVGDINALSPEDALFVLLVHPAFAKHLEGWGMGLHRVVDIVRFLNTQEFDWPLVLSQLQGSGVRTAAWATLYWVKLLAQSHTPEKLHAMLLDTQPGPVRRAWLRRWLNKNLSSRMSKVRLFRLVAFSSLLHDTPLDVARAFAGRRNAYRRQAADLTVFSSLDTE